eukprot:s474_g9.t1
MRTPVPCDSADASNLRYLAGFFDGDGCVSCSSDLSGCIVAVTQSFDKADVLMLLCEMFGGSIRRSRNGVGLWKPVLQWIACGQSARRAASLLAPHSITKRKQLLLAGAWPKQRSDREDCKVELRALKYSDSAVAGPCSWEYCAGFFDAEGCISQPGGGACLRLDIVQKHAQVLKCLSDFLAGSIGIHAKVSAATSTMHRLRVHGLRNCKQMLQCMLEAGLLCKAKQAELALGLTAENAMQVCAEFAHLTGNQQYGKRLDADGRQNIKMITTLRRQAGNMIRRKELHKAEVILRKLEVLQSEHELSKALNENVQLLEYSRGIEFLHDICWDGSRMHSFCSLAAVTVVSVEALLPKHIAAKRRVRFAVRLFVSLLRLLVAALIKDFVKMTNLTSAACVTMNNLILPIFAFHIAGPAVNAGPVRRVVHILILALAAFSMVFGTIGAIHDLWASRGAPTTGSFPRPGISTQCFDAYCQLHPSIAECAG